MATSLLIYNHIEVRTISDIKQYSMILLSGKVFMNADTDSALQTSARWKIEFDRITGNSRFLTGNGLSVKIDSR
jgi:hypothetical protein